MLLLALFGTIVGLYRDFFVYNAHTIPPTEIQYKQPQTNELKAPTYQSQSLTQPDTTTKKDTTTRK